MEAKNFIVVWYKNMYVGKNKLNYLDLDNMF